MKPTVMLMRLCSAAIVFLCCQSSIGQSLYPVSFDQKLNASELIIEGKVTEQKSFWNPQRTCIFTSNTIEVYKVFKGTISASTIEIMTTGGTVGTDNVTASDLLELSKGDIGVFFCYPNTINLRSPVSNKLLYDVWSSSQGFYKYNPVTLTANAPFARVNDIENNLYRVLEEKTGRSYRDIKAFRVTDLAKNNNSNRLQAVSVTDFAPTEVMAGATLHLSNILTINGTGFGTASGAAAVFFDDANDGSGGSFFGVAYNDPLVISWSSTQIVLRVPTRAGTGAIIVRDDVGATGSPALPLTVLSSVLTATFTSGTTVTKESNLMNTDGLGGYTIVYSTNTAGSGLDLDAAPEKATFQRALATWKELAGFNVTEGGTTTNQVIANDGINTIMFDNTNTGQPPLAAGVLGVCYSYNAMCAPLATNEAQKTGFDIVIRNAGVSSGSASFTIGPCPPASSSSADIDLETVLLHELGHALNLGHIIDSYEGSFLPQINPGKLMNFAVVNGVKRSTPDISAYGGAVYLTTPQGNTYGSCGLFAGEMVPLAPVTESKDECPTFPVTALPNGTIVAFDLVHTTSNRLSDPQYTALNCAGTGTGVTNTAFYAFKTAASGGGTLSLTVSGYGTTPAALASCTPTGGYPAAAGIELALYAVSSCPTGQAFPAPIACRTFNANGTLTAITGLAANTTYLLVADGIENTKAAFNLTFGGNTLPVSLLSFTAEKNGSTALLKWQTASEYNNDHFEIETSKDGAVFYQIGTQNSRGNSTSVQSYNFTDHLPAKGINYYRLKQVDIDGRSTYSPIATVVFEHAGNPISVFPNPVKDKLILNFTRPAENVTVSVFSQDGKLVRKESYGVVQRSRALNMNGLSAGVYIIKVAAGNDTYHSRFIKEP